MRDRVWAGRRPEVRAWEADKVAEEEWAVERWDPGVSVCAPSVVKGHLTGEVFPVSNRNVRIAEYPWLGVNRVQQ